MNTVDRLLGATTEIWKAYNEHPFVLGIQNGTLDKDKFRYYIIQDYLYLEEYAKTFAVGVAKAKSLKIANLFAKYISVMNGELDVYAQENAILMNELNLLTEDYTEKQIQHLVDIFVACSRYELAFWELSWRMSR